MKLLFDQIILSKNTGWIDEIQSHFPYFHCDAFNKVKDILAKKKGEKCLIISSAAAVLENLTFYKSLDDRSYPIMVLGETLEFRRLQEMQLELAGAILLPASIDELVDTIKNYQLAFRPKEFLDQSMTMKQSQSDPTESEDSMVAEKGKHDDLELGGIDIDDEGDNGDELILDSDIDQSVNEVDIRFNKDGSGIALSLDGTDSALEIETSEKNHETSSHSVDDESEVNLSFGNLELSASDEDEAEVNSSDQSNASLVFNVDTSETNEEVPEVSPENTGEFEINFSASDDSDSEEDDRADETNDIPPALNALEEDDADEIFGDQLDFSTVDLDDSEDLADAEISSEEEESLDFSVDGTAEFDLSAAEESDAAQEDTESQATSEELDIPSDLPDDDIPAPIPEKNPTKTVLNTSEPLERMPQTVMVRDKVDYNFDENEMVRLQVTLRGLKEEREKLLSTIQQQKNEIEELAQNNLGLKAEVDDQKIEIVLLKKRYHEKNEDANYHIRVSDEKKQLYEEKMRKMQHEFDQLNQKVRLDLTRVKQREKELESQLELVKMDADAQIKGRDQKIMELKRKIDSLEFNMENMAIREQQSKETHHQLEQKLHKLMGTLKGSMKILEDESVSSDDFKGKEG